MIEEEQDERKHEETKDGVDITLGIDGLVNKMIVKLSESGAIP